jgi:hypothetical protein
VAPRGKAAAVTSRGMKKKDLEPGAGFGDTAYIKKGDTVPVQFYHEPDDFLSFREHQWEEDRKWFFVPCIGDGCILCDDESDTRSRSSVQWAAQVYNIKEKKAQVLKFGKDLGNRIWFRYERKPSLFIKRVFEITKFATQPISHQVDVGEDKPIDLNKVKPIDLDEWRKKQLKAYYGDDIPTASDLEDDEDDFEDVDDEDEDDDLEDDEEFEDDEDEDDDLESDDDDEDEEPAPKPTRRKPAAAKPKPKAKPAATASRKKPAARTRR